MLRTRRPRLTYANVVSSLCLFMALGGTSYAVATGSIDSREIKNNTIRSSDLRDNKIETRDIRNNTIRTQDVRDGALLARDFKPGELPAGPRGQTGPTGARGPSGISGYVVRDPEDASLTATLLLSTGDQQSAVEHCPAGKHLLGGGIVRNDAPAQTQLFINGPTDDGTGWEIAAKYTGSNPPFVGISARVVCAVVG